MSITIKALILSKQMEAAQTTQYTAPSAGRAVIDKFTATNTTGSTATITVNLIQSLASVGASNVIVSAHDILAGETYTFPELVGHVLEASGVISTLGTASALTIRASGREIT
jgi:hypothetical protein